MTVPICRIPRARLLGGAACAFAAGAATTATIVGLVVHAPVVVVASPFVAAAALSNAMHLFRSMPDGDGEAAGRLTPEAVHRLASDALMDRAEDDEGITVRGVSMECVFHPRRLTDHADDIRALLAELPDHFRPGSGGGWGVAHARHDRAGRPWTDDGFDVDILLCMGLAIGAVRWLLPREMWPALPNEQPYVVIDPERTSPRDAA